MLTFGVIILVAITVYVTYTFSTHSVFHSYGFFFAYGSHHFRATLFLCQIALGVKRVKLYLLICWQLLDQSVSQLSIK